MNEAHCLASARGFLTLEDVDLIQEMVALLPLSMVDVLDLGAGSGTTALSIFCARSENIRVTTIDHSEEALMWASKAIENIGRLGDWRGICADSRNSDFYDGPPIDFLMLDTSHKYEDTKAELETWLPKLDPGTLVWLHDYSGGSYPGVKKALDEIQQEWPMQQIGAKGLGWGGRLL